MIQGTSRRFLGDLKSQSRMTGVCLLNSRLIDDTPLVSLMKSFNGQRQGQQQGATTRGNHKGGQPQGIAPTWSMH